MPKFNILSKFKSTKEIVRKDLDYDSGSEIREENPDDLVRDKGDLDYSIFDEMLLDDRVSMAMDLKKRLTLSVPADVIPASEDEKDIEIADEIKEQLGLTKNSKYQHTFGYSFWGWLDNLMDAMSYGYKVGEKVFQRDGSRIYLENVKFKHSKYFNFEYDEYGNLQTLIIGKNYGSRENISPINKVTDKFIVGTYPYPKDGNFYG